MANTRLSAGLVADALEETIPRIATTLRPDLLAALEGARAAETGERAQLVCDQLIENAAVAEGDHVPLCQDTGTVWVCLEVGTEEVIPGDIFSGVDAAVGRAYQDAALRMSVVRDALCDRSNTNTNAPAFCEINLREGRGATLHVMLKGGGSDNASQVVMLAPGAGWQGIKDAVIERVREKAANACPPLLVGIGVGATFDKVAGLAKHALLRAVGQRAQDPQVAQRELELLDAVNATGIGPGALGGMTTALDVHIDTAPCHIAALPLAINMGCIATRTASIELLGGERA